MPRYAPPVLYLLVLITVTPSAFADLSVVADLDSIACNGPDSLLIEPTDTVLVRIWLTGSDSLHSFGIILGDSSGALAWVEESKSVIYNTPGGWADVEVQEDAGWLLLQSTDFSLGNPIHADHEIARLRFIVTPGDSCGLLEGDLENSGWFHIETGEGTFEGFEGPVICVSHVLDGGDEGGEDGGGGLPDGGDLSPDEKYPHVSDLVEVMFSWESRVRLRNGILIDYNTDALSGVDQILQGIAFYEWERLISLPEEIVDEIQSNGEERSARPVYNMNNAYRLMLPDSTDVWTISHALESLPGVLNVRPVPLAPALPTPGDYVPLQGYLRAAEAVPSGVNADYAWTQQGGNGSGVTVCDIELCWNYNHEDISKASGSQINPLSLCEWWVTPAQNHGTASIGVLVSDSINSWGTTGICHGAELMTCGAIYDAGGGSGDYRPADAIMLAISHLSPGDVILLELEWEYGSYGLPIEWYGDQPPGPQTENSVFSAITNAVANGINVVEPGGNGDDDTDLLSWWGDSGAIIIGAGGAYDNDLQRLSFSSYGSRFDLQGWGEDVVTTGYGFLYDSEGKDLFFTDRFNGTSSAGAVVAGAITSFVGFWKANVSPTPPATETVRQILKETGTPQVVPPLGNIGPRPNLQAAFEEALQIPTSVTSNSGGIELETSPRLHPGRPNPFNPLTVIDFVLPERAFAELSIYNSAGRCVRTIRNQYMEAGHHSVVWDGCSDDEKPMASGVYFCTLNANGAFDHRRLVLIR